MAWIGQASAALLAALRSPASAPAWLWGAGAAALAVLSASWLWGFTVDDALISVRYARHLALGEGYRFNATGPSTDGVTPLAWPFLLWPLAHASALVVLGRAKALGLFVYAVAAAAWGTAVGRAPAAPWVKGVALVTLGLSVPCGAHAVSGMETALAMGLCTWASILPARPRAAALVAGLAASLRPELLPWATVIAVGFSAPSPLGALGAVALASAPFGACCLARLLAFGHVAPLAIAAKPSDVAHGLVYVGAASLAALAPLLAFAPMAIASAGRPVKTLALAGATHLAAVAVAGGDWMPYARLIAPIVPSILLVYVAATVHKRTLLFGALRAVLTLALGVYLLVTAAPAARHVGRDRERLVTSARPYLEHAGVVASLDVGWPSAATEATIVDLGGLTDPEVAALPGGQTSKRIDDLWLLRRQPDVLLAYTTRFDRPLDEWRSAQLGRVVEARLAASDLLAGHFVADAFLPLGGTGAGYLVLRRKSSDL
jgi:hypothetical protein